MLQHCKFYQNVGPVESYAFSWQEFWNPSLPQNRLQRARRKTGSENIHSPVAPLCFSNDLGSVTLVRTGKQIENQKLFGRKQLQQYSHCGDQISFKMWIICCLNRIVFFIHLKIDIIEEKKTHQCNRWIVWKSITMCLLWFIWAFI